MFCVCCAAEELNSIILAVVNLDIINNGPGTCTLKGDAVQLIGHLRGNLDI